MRRTLGLIGAIAALTLMAAGQPAEAKMVQNRLSANRLSANRLSANGVAPNMRASNRVAYNRVAVNSASLMPRGAHAGGGSVAGIARIELADGTRLRK